MSWWTFSADGGGFGNALYDFTFVELYEMMVDQEVLIVVVDDILVEHHNHF